MKQANASQQEELLDKLLHSKKYQDVCPDTVRRIFSECLLKYKKPKDAERAAREQLHGITGAFNDLGGEVQRKVYALESSDDCALTAILSRHASTRERLPLARMDALYAQIFEATGCPSSILDLACGLNPIYLLHRFDCDVLGVDISRSCVELIDAAKQEGSHGVCADLLCDGAIPAERFDICLLFKILPLLDRQRSGAAMDVLRRVNAEYIVISFPTRTLGGRNVGMEENYSAWMESHLPDEYAVAERFTAENELFYILKEK